MQLDKIVNLFLNNTLRKHMYFTEIAELFLRNTNNNLLYVEKSLQNERLLANRNCIIYLDYLNISRSEEEAKLIYEIINDPNMLDYLNLESVLNTIVVLEDSNYYPIIRKLVENKYQMNNYVFKCMFDAIFQVNNKLQLDAILSILKYPNIISNYLQLKFIVDKYLIITKKYQLESLDKFLANTNCIENFDLYSSNSVNLINKILEVSDYHAICLANSSYYILKFKYATDLIEKICKIEKPIVCRYINLLLTIPNILNSDNLFKFIDKLSESSDNFQMNAIVSILNHEKKMQISDYDMLNIITIINKCNRNQVVAILKIVYALENVDIEILFKYIVSVISETNNNKIDVLKEIIENYQVLGHDKVLKYIKRIKEADKKEYKIVLQTIKKELEKIKIKPELSSKKRVLNLGRK